MPANKAQSLAESMLPLIDGHTPLEIVAAVTWVLSYVLANSAASIKDAKKLLDKVIFATKRNLINEFAKRGQ